MFVLILAGALLGLPQERVDQLPEADRKWLTEEVPYLISEVERDVFLGLDSEQEREAFVDAFWRKRDENPTTIENEYRDEHYKRLAYVNEFFGRDTFREGWQTDRGRYYILLGPPRNRQNFDGSDAVYPTELWFYDNPDLKQYGLPPFFSLLFFRRHGAGELEIYSPILDGPQALLTGTDTKSADFRQDVERAYDKLSEVDPELAQASLSFRTDEGDTAQFSGVSFGTMELMDQIVNVPFHGLDTSYAERLDFERGAVESDYSFRYVQSVGAVDVLEGDGGVTFVHWVIEMPPENIAFVLDREKGVYGSSFIVSVEAVLRDDPNVVVVQSRNESFVELEESQRASLHGPFAYSGMTPLVPGAYDFQVILRNRACPSRVERECAKSYTLLAQEIDVPPPTGKALRGLLIGYGSESKTGTPLYRAYRFGAVEILPNPSGVYAIGDSMTVAVVHERSRNRAGALRRRESGAGWRDHDRPERGVERPHREPSRARALAREVPGRPVSSALRSRRGGREGSRAGVGGRSPFLRERRSRGPVPAPRPRRFEARSRAFSPRCWASSTWRATSPRKRGRNSSVLSRRTRSSGSRGRTSRGSPSRRGTTRKS